MCLVDVLVYSTRNNCAVLLAFVLCAWPWRCLFCVGSRGCAEKYGTMQDVMHPPGHTGTLKLPVKIY